METSKWHWFNLTDKRLFSKIEKCKCSNATELLVDGNEITYIGAKKRENGIMAFVQNNSSLLTKGNCIVLIGDGQGSVGYSTYQPNDFIGSTTLIAAYNKNLNVYNAMFLVSVLDMERYRYSFGRKYNKKAISNTYIKLPVDKNGFPDWKYMEIHVKKTFIPKLPILARKVWENKYNIGPIQKKSINLNDRDWSYFQLGDKRLFKIKKGKRLTKADMIDGELRYIGAIEGNNGVSAYIANDDHIHPANTITVSYNGSVAEAFYQEEKFWATDDVNVLYPTFKLNKYIALFITTIIRKEKYRFNYGRKWDKVLMEKSKIKLPIDTQGNPDWQFMENYIKSLPYSSNI